MTVFAVIAIVFTFIAIGLVVWPLLRAGSGTHPVAATLTAVAIPAAVLVVYLFVSNHDWQLSATGGPTPAPGSVEEAVASLEQKLAANPADEEGWILLGSSYLSLDRPADAANAYQKALDASGGRSVDARLGVAEARIVLDPGSLEGTVGDEIEAILKLEPRNPKALWYGGLLGMARGQPGLARERWQVLLELSPPERVREIIESQLAQLSAGTAPPASAAPAAANEGIGITIAVSEALRARVSASAPLFVFVRDSNAPGPPLAVIRRQASDLPVTLQISDVDIMLPGRTLAGLEAATLVARVANGGDPIAKPGDVYGEAQWQRAEGKAGAVSILIDRVVEP